MFECKKLEHVVEKIADGLCKMAFTRENGSRAGNFKTAKSKG